MLDLGLRLALCAGLAAALGGAVLEFGHHERDVGRAEVRAEWRDDKAQQQAAVIADRERMATETQRRISAMQEIVNDATAQKTAALADAGSARAELGRLRQQQARYVASVRAGLTPDDSAPSTGGATAGAALDLLSDMFSESDEAEGILAAALDSARAAGLACERAYGSLTSSKSIRPEN